MYSGYPEVIEGYTDANWVTDKFDVKSTTGYLFLLGGAAVSCGSCKQTIITRSTLESDLTALDTTCTEAQWLKDLINDIDILSPNIFQICLNCDCRALIDLLNQHITNKKMNNHILIRYKSIRNKMKESISLQFIRSKHNLADLLTKGLLKTRVFETSRGMGLKPIY